MSDPYRFHSLEHVRRVESRWLSVALQAQAILAGFGIGFVLTFPTGGPFNIGMLVAGGAVLAVLSAFAAMLEWNRDKLGEAFALASLGLGFVVTMAYGLSGLWFVAPVMGGLVLVLTLLLAQRYLDRDEPRHVPIKF